VVVQLGPRTLAVDQGDWQLAVFGLVSQLTTVRKVSCSLRCT
jgi:hypothetical protein